MNARRLILASLCAVAYVLALGAATAGATKVVTGSFGASGSEAGQFGSKSPTGIAVNQTGAGGVNAGDVYAIDHGNYRIDESSSTGVFVRAFGLNVGGTGVDVCTTTCKAGASSAAADGFAEPYGIAIDQSNGTVYVVDIKNKRVDVFSATGVFEGAFGWDVNEASPKEELQFCTTTTKCKAGTAGAGAGELGTDALDLAVAPGTSDVYLSDYTNKRVDEFAPTISGGVVTGVSFVHAFGWGVVNGAAELQSCTTASGCEAGLTGAGAGEFGTNSIEGIAVDSTGAIYVVNKPSNCAEANPCRVEKFNAAGTSATEFAPEQLKFTSGTSSSEAANLIAVETSDNHVYVARPNSVATERDVLEFESDGALVTTDGLGAGLPAATGLAAGIQSSVYFSASTTGEIYVLQRVPHPSIEGLFSTDVASTSATLQGQIAPNGSATDYYFQYGTESCAANPSACVDVPTPPGVEIGTGEAPEPVSLHVQALLPDTLYHYRLVATSGVGVSEAENTFTTPSGGGSELVLPDGRQWELVSPPTKDGATIQGLGVKGTLQAAANGGAITYLTNAPVGETAGDNGIEVSQILSQRGSGGWSSQDIETPVEVPDGEQGTDPAEYRLFSSDLTLGLVEPRTEVLLSPEATEGTLYLRDAQSGSYLPLATAANVPTGTKFGGLTTLSDEEHAYDLSFLGATPDLSHIAFESTDALTANAVKDGTVPNMYEWSGGTLKLVSVLPNGEPATAQGLTPYLGVDEARDVGSRDAISNDGSRIYWTGRTVDAYHLYLRDTASEETVQVDAAQGVAEPAAANAEALFNIASSDGSRVFFTDGQDLTPGATAAKFEPDLYEFEVTSGAGEPLAGRLTDLTVDEHSGEHADVQGQVLGASEDGSSLYIVATGVLTESENANKEKAAAKADNLYLLHYTGAQWTTTFVATLSSEDQPDWEVNKDHQPAMTARVSPNGGWLAFMSKQSLTGYDNHDANSGAPDEEAFLYDAETDRIICASCNPTGARPVGVEDLKSGTLLVDRDQLWATEKTDHWVAAFIPGWTKVTQTEAYVESRYLSNSGRLFFDSSDALVPQDTNGTEDVYEYEPEGIGSCTGSSTTFDTRMGGCVGLISSGTSDEESAFLEASENGDDVFFMTTERLVPEDYDSAYDIYDAHVCGGEGVPCTEAVTTPPPCTTADSCRAAPSPQPSIFGAPPSATFAGPGNLAPLVSKPATKPKAKPLTRTQKLAKALKKCKKKAKAKRKGCEAAARKKYGAKKKAKANKKTKAKKSTTKRSDRRGN